MVKQPTLEQVLALFSLCHICQEKAHPNTQDCCDECDATNVEAAYNDCFDTYGSSD